MKIITKKNILLGLLTLVLISMVFAILNGEIDFNNYKELFRNNFTKSEMLSSLSTIFTGLAAFATAFAAYSASKSAQIAEATSSIWKTQMLLDIELNEAKRLKVALHAWHRSFMDESYSRECSIKELVEHFDVVKKDNNLSFQVHFRNYIEQQVKLFSELEVAFDQAGFIDHSFDERIRLRRLYLVHIKKCESLIEHVSQSNINIPRNFLPETLTAIYWVNDWNEYNLNGSIVNRVKMELRNEDGSYREILKSDGSNVYGSLIDEVQSWFTQIGIKVDLQINNIKRQITTETK